MKDINSYKNTKYDYRKKILNLEKEIEKKEQEKEDQNIIIDKLRNEINDILNSKSWRVTKPLRSISERFSKKEEIINNKNAEEKDAEKEEFTNTINLEEEKVSLDNYLYKNFKAYNSVYQDNMDFSGKTTDIKTITFYLPQYHTFKENDECWI